MLKKSTKIWICSSLVGAVIIGGAFASRSYWMPKSGGVFSQCSFSPDISAENKALIDETITTVAENGVFSLAGKRSRLEEIGTILSREVPDLSYWAYILSTPKLAEDAKKIQHSSLKYNGFVEGTKDRIMKEYQQNPCLLKQAAGFAKYLGLPEEETVSILKECIDHSEEDDKFEKFLDYIINKKTGSVTTGS